MSQQQGPLAGVKVVHLAAWGPGPYATMLLADLGCEVIVVDRRSAMITTVPAHQDPRRRSQKSIALDLKDVDDLATFNELIRQADVFIEGMRPGAAERLGIGPDQLQRLNKGLVYGRMTGWGQQGELAHTAGHDINYIALSGVLETLGEPGKVPPLPLNLLGDYGGGGLFLVMGILAALFERTRSGLGQVVDGAIVDGVASLSAATLGMLSVGRWGDRGTNTFDGSCPWYRAYQTSDKKYVAVGAIEEAFYQQLLQGLGMDSEQWQRSDPDIQAKLTAELETRFAERTRDEWQAIFERTDACVTPVLSFAEAMAHGHHKSRATYISMEGIHQPAPAPRFSRTPLSHPQVPPDCGADSEEIREQLSLFGDH
jgi:alpha-methylacyl-CoA racemase